MYPHERSLVKQLAGKPFEIVGVNSDSSLEKVREVVAKKNLTWRSFQNESSTGTISEKWAVQGWPTIYLIDQEGVIRYKGHSVSDAKIEELLAEMGHEVNLVMDDPGEREDEEDDDDDKDNDDDDKSKKKSDKEADANKKKDD